MARPFVSIELLVGCPPLRLNRGSRWAWRGHSLPDPDGASRQGGAVGLTAVFTASPQPLRPRLRPDLVPSGPGVPRRSSAARPGLALSLAAAGPG